MAYYGSGYSSGIGQNFNPIVSSPQAGAIPTSGGYYNAQASMPGPTADSKAMQGSNVADKIQTPALGSLLNGGGQGAINEQQKMAGLPSWASDYIQGRAGAQGNMGQNQLGQNNFSSGQLNDAYYSSAPTLGGIYSQYGSSFDPSKFIGLGDGSLMGLEQSLGSQGYGLDNIGGYYQTMSQLNGPQAGVNYSFDPTLAGVMGSIGGLNFDVTRGFNSGVLGGGYDKNFLNNPASTYKPGAWSGAMMPGSTYNAGSNPMLGRVPQRAGSGIMFPSITRGGY